MSGRFRTRSTRSPKAGATRPGIASTKKTRPAWAFDPVRVFTQIPSTRYIARSPKSERPWPTSRRRASRSRKSARMASVAGGRGADREADGEHLHRRRALRPAFGGDPLDVRLHELDDRLAERLELVRGQVQERLAQERRFAPARARPKAGGASQSRRRSRSRSRTTDVSADAAAVVSASGPTSSQLWRTDPIRQGRVRPGAVARPPRGSRTCPSWRRWNEQLAGESPRASAAAVAVSSPSRATSSMSSIRVGCARARMTRGSVSRRSSKDMFRKISFESRRVNRRARSGAAATPRSRPAWPGCGAGRRARS